MVKHQNCIPGGPVSCSLKAMYNILLRFFIGPDSTKHKFILKTDWIYEINNQPVLLQIHLIDRLGRRPLVITPMIVISALLLTLTICDYFQVTIDICQT